jgi:hypothetical protein
MDLVFQFYNFMTGVHAFQAVVVVEAGNDVEA